MDDSKKLAEPRYTVVKRVRGKSVSSGSKDCSKIVSTVPRHFLQQKKPRLMQERKLGSTISHGQWKKTTRKKSALIKASETTTTKDVQSSSDESSCSSISSDIIHAIVEAYSPREPERQKSGQSETTTTKKSEPTTPNDVVAKVSCSSIKAMSSDIIRVWEGFSPEEQTLRRVFVVVVKKMIDNLEEKVQSCLSNKKLVRVIQRLPNEVSDEAKTCLEKEANLPFSLEEHNKIRDTLLRNSEKLMKTHSNLEIVSASSFRSKQKGKRVIHGSCIVMYVHVKGIIPVNEKHFPPKLGDFPVDVREGVFTNFADPQLAIGSIITGKKDTGKIAGFVQLSSGNIGCLTCAHVFNIHENMEVDDTESTQEDVYQLSPCGSSAPFGTVYQRIYEPGFLKNETEYKIGIDAALIEITDKLRYPKDGNYKHSVSSSVECASTLDYYSGEILTSPEEVAKMHTVNNMKCKIVRYNEDKRKLYVRTGRIKVDSTSVRLKPYAWCPPTPNEACQLYAQIHVQPDPDEILDVEDKSFATYGDSGSLVFLVSDDGEHMWAFGMVVGGIEADGSAIVTPISAVLDAFGLPPKFMSFIYLGSQFNELSAKVDKMDKKIDEILTYIKGKDSNAK